MRALHCLRVAWFAGPSVALMIAFSKMRYCVAVFVFLCIVFACVVFALCVLVAARVRDLIASSFEWLSHGHVYGLEFCRRA